MSANASVKITWADGEHAFRLPIGKLRELQDKTSAGPGEILDRLRGGTWRVDDVRETIRLGLIGGGMAPIDAFTLIVRYVDERPLAESIPVAFAVMLAAVVGVPDDKPPPGKEQSESHATTDGSGSPNFTAQEPQSDSHLHRSMN